jgi:hypothetical protein
MANAAATQAQGVANLGASIGGAIAEVGDYFKKQAEDEKKVQKSLSVAKAIGDLIPGLQPTIQGSLNILNDKELPLSQRTAEADAIADILNLGINEVRNRQDVGLKERELGIREAQFMADNAPSQRTVNLQQGEITETIDGKAYKVPITFNPATGETRRLDGSIVGQGFQSADMIDAGLNLPMPTAGQTAMPGDGTFPDYGTPAEAMVLPPRVDSAAIAAAAELTGGQSDVSNVSPMPSGTPTTTQTPIVDGVPTSQTSAGIIPPGATPVEVDGAKSFRRATPEEAAGYGATAGQIDEQTNRFYPINLPSGMTVESDGQGGIKVVQGAGVGAKADQQQKAVDSKIDKAMALTQDLNLLESRTQSMAPGVSGAVGRIVAEQIPATPQAENKEIIDRVIATLTLENLQAMRNNNPTGASLGNVSDKDTGLLRSSATALNNAQSPESFKRELVRLKNLQHDVIYGSERVLKQKLDKGEITKSQFDEAMANAPSEYLDDRGAVRTRKPIVSTLGTGSGSNDIYKEFGIK